MWRALWPYSLSVDILLSRSLLSGGIAGPGGKVDLENILKTFLEGHNNNKKAVSSAINLKENNWFGQTMPQQIDKDTRCNYGKK